MQGVHWWIYAYNGQGLKLLFSCGEIAMVVSTLCFLWLLMLLAKGWTISTTTLHGAKTTMITVGLFAIVNLVIKFKEYSSDETNRNTEISDGFSMFLDVSSLAWLAFGVWYIYRLHSSYSQEYKPAKRSFLLYLGLMYLPWVISFPVLQLLVQVLDPWVRPKVITSVTLTITFIVYASMAYLLAPERVKIYFDTSASTSTPLSAVESTFSKQYELHGTIKR